MITLQQIKNKLEANIMTLAELDNIMMSFGFYSAYDEMSEDELLYNDSVSYRAVNNNDIKELKGLEDNFIDVEFDIIDEDEKEIYISHVCII